MEGSKRKAFTLEVGERSGAATTNAGTTSRGKAGTNNIRCDDDGDETPRDSSPRKRRRVRTTTSEGAAASGAAVVVGAHYEVTAKGWEGLVFILSSTKETGIHRGLWKCTLTQVVPAGRLEEPLVAEVLAHKMRLVTVASDASGSDESAAADAGSTDATTSAAAGGNDRRQSSLDFGASSDSSSGDASTRAIRVSIVDACPHFLRAYYCVPPTQTTTCWGRW